MTALRRDLHHRSELADRSSRVCPTGNLKFLRCAKLFACWSEPTANCACFGTTWKLSSKQRTKMMAAAEVDTSRRVRSAEDDADSSDEETEDVAHSSTEGQASGGQVIPNVPAPEACASADRPSASLATGRATTRSPSCRCPRSEAPFSSPRPPLSAGLANDEVPCICCAEDTDPLNGPQVQQSAVYAEGVVSVQSRVQSSVTTSASTGPVTRTLHLTTTISSVSPAVPVCYGYTRRCANSCTTVCVPLLVDHVARQAGRASHGIVRQPSIRRRSVASSGKNYLSSHYPARGSLSPRPEYGFKADEVEGHSESGPNSLPRVCATAAVTVKELAASLKDPEKNSDEPIRFFFTTPSPTVENSAGLEATGGPASRRHFVEEARTPPVGPAKAVPEGRELGVTGTSPSNNADSGCPAPKVPERPTDLPSKKRPQDVGRVTAEVLSTLYEPFGPVRPVLLRQAAEICSCKYFGDVHRFKSHFLLPVAQLLRFVKTEVHQLKAKAACSPTVEFHIPE